MQKKILVTMLMTSLVVGLVGCGSAEEVTEIPTSTETIVEETSIEAEETVVEETTVVETVVETVEETEVVEAEPMTFEREDFTLYTCVTNFGENYSNPHNDYRLINSGYTYSVNDYMDIEIMTELANRGYDISDFTVSWMVAVNKNGTWSNGELTYGYSEFADSDEEFVKLYPIFLKTNGIDSSRIVYNTNSNREDLTEYAIRENTDTNVYYAIHQAVADMKADENYVEIDFKIPDSYFKTKTEESLIENVSTEESIIVKNLTLNDWYNGMIYAMFVSKTVDLDGLFDHDCTS